MKKILVFLFSFLMMHNLFSVVNSLALVPGMGMMKTHYIIPIDKEDDELYQYIIINNSVLNSEQFDRIAVGIISIDNVQNENDANCAEVTINYNGYFSSDENSSIVRPYKVYYVERTNRWGDGGTQNRVGDEIRPNGDSFDFPSPEIIKLNKSSQKFVWIDFMLQLDDDNYDENGVTVDNVYYPLIAGTYSSEISIDVKVYTDKSKTTLIDSASITIPLMAEHTTDRFEIMSTERNSQVSMNVVPTANAVNMNLSDMLKTGSSVNIGSLSFMIRASSNSSNADSCAEGDKIDGNRYRIFLSSSDDPFDGNAQEFKFVHQSFVDGEDSYNARNSVNFYVRVTGSGDSYGKDSLYNGTAHADLNTGNVSEGNGGSGIALVPSCKKYKVLNEGDYTHYHTYEGDLSLYVDPNPNNILNAGRYSGYIYIHVISMDGGAA